MIPWLLRDFRMFAIHSHFFAVPAAADIFTVGIEVSLPHTSNPSCNLDGRKE